MVLSLQYFEYSVLGGTPIKGYFAEQIQGNGLVFATELPISENKCLNKCLQLPEQSQLAIIHQCVLNSIPLTL